MNDYETGVRRLRAALEAVETIAETWSEARGGNAAVERHLLDALKGAANEAAGRAHAVAESLKGVE